MEFNEAVQFILRAEGGYVCNINDPGGETKFGISKRAYPHLDIKALTAEEAIAIYHRDYWGLCGIDALPPLLRLPVFDAAVNQGPGFAIGTAQAVVGAKIDGLMGPKTLEKLSACDPVVFLQKYMWRRLQHYAANQNWKIYGAGWSARLIEMLLANRERAS